MNKVNIKFLIISVVLILYFLFTELIVFPYYRNIYLIIEIVFWLLIGTSCYFFFKNARIKKMMTYDANQIIVIYSILFFVVTYIIGIFFGFQRNPISLTIKSITSNLLIYGFIIVMQEYLRFILAKSSSHKIYDFIIIVVLFSLLNLNYDIFSAHFNSSLGIFKFLNLNLLPIIAKNILFTYIAFHIGYGPNIIYRFIFELYLYLVPIVPNLGLYIESLINLLFPFFMLTVVSEIYLRYNQKMPIVKKKKNIFLMLNIVIIFFLLCLIGGIGKYQIIGIASNSMNPVFARGDAVIYMKYKYNDKIKVGDIIAYEKDNITVVHRIILIKEDKNYVITKGDNNNTEDKWTVNYSQIKGKVVNIVPYVGFPSIWLQEQLSPKNQGAQFYHKS